MLRVAACSAIVCFILATACVNVARNASGVEEYEGVGTSGDLTYAVAPGTPGWVKDLTKVAIAHWNTSLGRRALRFVDNADTARVLVQIDDAAGVAAQPAHTDLLG